jgi:hypothetical protein
MSVRSRFASTVTVLAACGLRALAQEPAAPSVPPAPSSAKTFVVAEGTHVPLSMINSVSTKSAAPGERVYLETAFPILVAGKMVIPPGSYVAGTVTNVKRPGKVKGRGEFYLRFDSLTLPNGTTRDFTGSVAGLDGSGREELDRKEGVIKSGSNKGSEAAKVGATTASAASAGAIAGNVAGHAAMGAGIGAAAGAAAGVMAVLLTRGPDAVLSRGSSVEMVLDRSITYDESELDFSGVSGKRTAGTPPAPPRRPGSK